MPGKETSGIIPRSEDSRGIECLANQGRAIEAASWALLALIASIVIVWMVAADFAFDWSSAARPLAACLVLGPVIWFYRGRRPNRRIEASLTAVLQLVAFGEGGMLLSYLMASAAGPLWDPTLHAWDRALGLDWRAYLGFVNAHPGLGLCYTLAYQSLMLQLVIAVVALGLGGHLAACRSCMMAVILSGLVTILISGAMPAMDMYVHLGLNPQDYPNLRPAAAFVHVSHMDALRDGSMRMLSLRGAEGIITFPSYHAVLAVILAASLWESRWLRWPALLLNAAVVAATPIDGGHYFIDVFAGATIAVLSLVVARASYPLASAAGALAAAVRPGRSARSSRMRFNFAADPTRSPDRV